MKNLIFRTVILATFLSPLHSSAQSLKKALFLGNSYTGVNDLPKLVSDAAASAGDTLIFDSNTPGGYYIAQHLANQASMAKVAASSWDNVILQDQSMALAYPSTFMNFLPYCVTMDSTIKAQNRCAQTMFYATWGRKPGDQYVCAPPECDPSRLIVRTYFEMDSAIGSHYKVFADTLKASVSPVGTVWRYIRRNYPAIELYQTDDSHPSVAGSYAAACCFYTAIFRRDPSLITFTAGLAGTDAANIRTAVKEVVYNHLTDWNIGVYDHLLDSSCRPLSIDDTYRKTSEWRIAPNPVTDILTVELDDYQDGRVIAVYNVYGKLIKEVATTQASVSIDLSAYPQGVYIIRSSDSPRAYKVLKR